MLYSFFKTSSRNLTREKTYSMINIAGLTLGILSGIMIALWADYELSYDDMYVHKDRIYRVYHNNHFKDYVSTHGQTAARVADQLYTFPAVEKVGISRATIDAESLLSRGQTGIHASGYFVTQEYLDIFQFPLVAGNLSSAFSDPQSIVITESTARSLFPDGKALHQVIRFEDSVDVKVAAVLKDIPHNSSIEFDFLVPLKLYEVEACCTQECLEDWTCTWFNVYVQTKQPVDYRELGALVTKKAQPFLDEDHGENAVEELFLYPMERWHLYGRFEEGVESGEGKMELVRNMSWLAALIIVVACINFMNLSTARSMKRSLEVGIRKVSGSSRKQLIVQFLGESILSAAIAFFVAITLVQLMLPLFNAWLDIRAKIDFISPSFWAAGTGLILFVGCLAGSYPAFYLSSFSPANVLRRKINASRSNIIFSRQFLVVLQFGISSCLIVGTIALKKQIDFGLGRATGFDKAGLITIPDNEEFSKKYEAIKQKLLASGAIESMVKTNSPITDIYEINYLTWEGNAGPPISCTNIFTDYGYFKTLGVKLLEGRDFSPTIASDTAAVIFNKAAIDLLPFEDPIGKQVYIGPTKLTIIGVSEDVVMGNPFHNVSPLYMVYLKDWNILYNNPNITIRLTRLDQLDNVRRIITSVVTKHPFEYSFVDQDYEHKFSSLKFLMSMTNAFAALAIIIACLGLFALAAYTAEQRQRELCIRKIHGASVVKLVKLVLTDFVKLIVISYALFAPIGAYLIRQYIERYDWRVTLSWAELLMIGVVIVFIAICITSVQVIRASTRNPAEVLKAE